MQHQQKIVLPVLVSYGESSMEVAGEAPVLLKKARAGPLPSLCPNPHVLGSSSATPLLLLHPKALPLRPGIASSGRVGSAAAK